MACGFIGEVQHSGLAVPRDVSVMGFDDIELVSHMTPALSTIRQPREAIGRQAAQCLLAMIGGEEAAGDIGLGSSGTSAISPSSWRARLPSRRRRFAHQRTPVSGNGVSGQT